MPDLDANAELGSLPFDALIGSPLVAVVNAQKASARSSLDFLEECIGPNREIKTVGFSYMKTYEQNGRPVEQRHTLTVPLLTLVQIPFLRIEEVNINFNVKLSSHKWDKATSDHNVGASASGGFGIGAFGVKLEGSYSYNRKTDRGTEVNREHSLTVYVKAVQDQMPSGMERILSILDTCVKEKPEAAKENSPHEASKPPVGGGESQRTGHQKDPAAEDVTSPAR